MSDLDRVKEILNQGYTCVLVSGEKILTSTKTGISPMIEFLSENKNMQGFSAADKIVGKAVALLFAKAKVKEIYAEVLSETAIPILKKYEINYSYKIITKQIINRKGDDICPMEKVVQNIEDPEEAFVSLKRKLAELKSSK